MVKKINKKGFYFTLDALFALVILLLVISLLTYTNMPRVEPKYKSSFIQEDAMQMLSVVKTSDINNSIINSIVSKPIYNETLYPENDNLIDTISKLWSVNTSESFADARNVSAAFFDDVIEADDNFGIFFTSGQGLDIIFNKSKIDYNSSQVRDFVVAREYISGVQKGSEITGHSARAFLQKKERTKFVYFGGYIGDGNITARVELPNATITNVTMELALLNSAQLWINDNYVENIQNSSNALVPITYTLNPIYFTDFKEGTNLIEFRNDSNKSYISIAGGYIKIVYRTDEIEYVSSQRQYLHGISGIINEYDSIFAPNTIESMNAKLHYKVDLSENQPNATFFFKIGGVIVYENTTNTSISDAIIELNDSSIRSSFNGNYETISNKTIPIRVGFKELAAAGGGAGNADVVLITDVSGSMDYRNIPCSSVWQISNTHYDGGSFGAESQDINDSQSVCIYRIINVPNDCTGNKCTISFRWKVSSQNNDDLNFYDIDPPEDILRNNPNAQISGDVDWVERNLSIPRAQRKIGWCYVKNASDSALNDMGYIDYIRVFNSTGQIIFSENFESGLNGWNSSCGTQKLAVARDVDKIFVNTVLNASGNKIGLIAYSSNNYAHPDSIWWKHDLSEDNLSLRNQIDSYSPQSATCISCGILNATRILVTQGIPGRFKGMLVMTDGLANLLINKTSTGNGYTFLAGMEATNKSCEARNATNNITVFAVGFGNDTDIEQVKRMACWNCTACPDVGRLAPVSNNSICWIQDVTLPNGTVTTCLKSRWAVSNNYEELKRIYKQFGEWFVGLSYSEQRVEVTGNFSSTLYNDSYIDYNYSGSNIITGCTGCSIESIPTGGDIDADTIRKYGNVLTFESPLFKNSRTNFSFSNGWILEALATSYSGSKWTKTLAIDNTSGFVTVYNLSEYSTNYLPFGDPFRVNIPTDKIGTSVLNTVELKIGNSTLDDSDASDYDKVIYSILVLSNYSYSNVTRDADGCNWTVEYYDGTYGTFPVPSTYTGNNKCYYNSTDMTDCISDPTTENLVENDAMVQAAYILFRNYLDTINGQDCRLDIKTDEYIVNAVTLPSVPFLYYTTAQFATWR
jgi:hypothetical protein